MTFMTPPDKIRLDRWLWAARFFKTRSLAASAIDGGKVQLNATRVKRSQQVQVGDQVRIRRPPYEFVVEVRALSEHRGPASEAQVLYAETAESLARRETLREQLRAQPTVSFEGKGRPTKKDRRRLDQFKQGR
jgi:ribosome-associated heat shock protein Hsp15